MAGLEFSSKIQAAIAIGARLNVEGQLTWSKDNNQISMKGEAKAFVGAQANVSGKLSVKAAEGINMQIPAGAFVGFKAEVQGACIYSYAGKDVVKVAAEAAVLFGVGGEFKAGIKASLFGPTEFTVKAGVAVVMGASASAELSVDFDTAILAANANFMDFDGFYIFGGLLKLILH